MVRSTLDGFPVEELQQRFPGMEAFLDQVQADPPAMTGPRDWWPPMEWRCKSAGGLMGPTLRVAFGLQDLDDAEIRTAVAAADRQHLAAE